MTDKISAKVFQLVANQLRVDLARVNLETAFKEDLRADSLDLVELIMVLEETFDLEIEETAAEGIKTVGDAVAYIQKHVN